MTQAITEEQPRDAAAPSDTPGNPPADDGLQALLDEFDRANPQQPEPDAPEQNGQTNSADELDAFIASLDTSADKQRADELQSRVDSLQLEAHRAQELEAFKSFVDDLQSHMPPWAPPDYAEAKLKALAFDPTISLAWELRSTDRQAAKQELLRVQWELMQLQQNPTADQGRVRELQQYGAKLDVAIHANAILRQARLGIINEANKLPPPIDVEQSQIRADVAFAMKGASAPITPEPPPDLSKMSDAELRRYTLENFGF
jgi:hypothetical protein